MPFQDACVKWKYCAIITDDVNTNTIQGYDGTNGTSSCPTGQRKSVNLSLSSKQETWINMGIIRQGNQKEN